MIRAHLTLCGLPRREASDGADTYRGALADERPAQSTVSFMLGIVATGVAANNRSPSLRRPVSVALHVDELPQRVPHLHQVRGIRHDLVDGLVSRGISSMKASMSRYSMPAIAVGGSSAG
jgi:hypothetical protein